MQASCILFPLKFGHKWSSEQGCRWCSEYQISFSISKMEVALLLKLSILAVCTNLLSGSPLQFQQGIYNGANLLSSYQGLLPQYQMPRLSNTIPYYSTGGILPNSATGKLVRAETATYVPAGSLVMLPSMTRDTGLPGLPVASSITDPITGQTLPTGSVIPGTGGLPVPVSSPLGNPACALAGALGNTLTNSLCCGATLSLPCLGNGLVNNGLLGGLTPGLTPGVVDLQTLLTAYSLLASLSGFGGLAGGGLGGLSGAGVGGLTAGGLGGLTGAGVGGLTAGGLGGLTAGGWGGLTGGGLGGGCLCNSGLQIQLPICCQPSILSIIPNPVPISGPSALPAPVGDSTLPVSTPVTSAVLPGSTPVTSAVSPVSTPVTSAVLPVSTPVTSAVSPGSTPVTSAVSPGSTPVTSTSSPVPSTPTTGSVVPAPVSSIVG